MTQPSYEDFMASLIIEAGIEPSQKEDGSYSYSWGGAIPVGPQTFTFIQYPKWCRWGWLEKLYDRFIRKEKHMSVYVTGMNIKMNDDECTLSVEWKE